VKNLTKPEAIEVLTSSGSSSSSSSSSSSDPVGPHLDDDAIIRVVVVGGGVCPCGGTHVKRTSEVGKIVVTKLKAKKDTIRVSYKIVE